MENNQKSKKVNKERNKRNSQASSFVGNNTQAVPNENNHHLDMDTSKEFIDEIIEAGLSQKLDVSALEDFTRVSNNRDQLYYLIDTMAQDSSVSSILRTYAEDVCEPSDNGHIVWCESSDPNISKFINYVLNVMNVDKNIYGWAYSLIKYGDVYLRLYRESDYKDALFSAKHVQDSYKARNVLNEEAYNNMFGDLEGEELKESVNLLTHKMNDPYSYYVEMISDPSTMFELTKFGKTYGFIEVPNAKINMSLASLYEGNGQNPMNYRLKSNDIIIYQADDFVHACLEDNNTRFPETVDIFRDDNDLKANTNSYSYNVRRGKSILYDSYKIWREKALLENAALLNRITKSSIVRKVSVEVGDMPKDQVSNTLRRVKELFEQKAAINVGNTFSEYNNPGPIENNIYHATRNGQGAITVDSVGGDVDVKGLADLDWWNNKFYSSYGIPKQYFGWCLRGDTKLQLLNGESVAIEELYQNKEKYINKGILGVNKAGKLIPTKISNIMLTKEHSNFLRIHLDNGKYVDVTPDHRMMLRDGSFVAAEFIKEGDSLMPNRDFDFLEVPKNDLGHKVTKVEKLNIDEPAYDITVEDDCHTFALECGIFVHNCDDGAGFNGGSSLTILSSVYSKGVKRVQNALIQTITDIISLVLVNKGLTSYLNNFKIRMKAPVTQEEIDYREEMTNKIQALSNFQAILTDVEDKPRRLRILRELVATLDYGNGILNEISDEIDAAEEAKVLEAEELEKEKKEEEKNGSKDTDLGISEKDKVSDDVDLGLDLGDLEDSNEEDELPSPDKLEGFKPNENQSIFLEDTDFDYNNQMISEDSFLENLPGDKLPSPESIDAKRDFTKNLDYNEENEEE